MEGERPYCYKCKRSAEVLDSLDIKIYKNGYCRDCQRAYMQSYNKRLREGARGRDFMPDSADRCGVCNEVFSGEYCTVIDTTTNEIVTRACGACCDLVILLIKLLTGRLGRQARQTTTLRALEMLGQHPRVEFGRPTPVAPIELPTKPANPTTVANYQPIGTKLKPEQEAAADHLRQIIAEQNAAKEQQQTATPTAEEEDFVPDEDIVVEVYKPQVVGPPTAEQLKSYQQGDTFDHLYDDGNP